MTAKPLRIGFCGVGRMGQMAHLRNYAVEPSCTVTAIAEPRAKTAQAVARRYAVPRVYNDARDMLDAETLDAIVACRPFACHGGILPMLLEAGIPIFIEKPLAGSVAVGETIVSAVRDSGTFLMIGYHKRSDPAVMFAKRKIDELKGNGRLGALRYVRMIMPPGDWVAGGFEGLIDEGDAIPEVPSDPPPDDMDRDTFDAYLTFVNYYIHQVNLLRHFLGEPYRVTHADPSGVLMIGRSEAGVTCTLEMAPYRTTRDWQEEALVCFEHGWLRVRLPAPLASNRPGSVEIFSDPPGADAPQRTAPTLPPVHAMRQQCINFLAAVAGREPPLTDAEEALEDLRVARDYIELCRSHTSCP